MRKLFTALLMLALLHILGVSAFAETSVTMTQAGADSGNAVTVVDWNAAQDGAAPVSSDKGAGGVAAVPVRDTTEASSQSVETLTENGVVIVKKTYELTPDGDPQTLVQGFEQDGSAFTCREILRRELPGETLTRQATKTALTETESGDMAEIMPQFPDTIDFEDGGYSGRLFLDASTMSTEASGYEPYSYATTEMREIPGLDRNDPSLINREWNGMALSGMSFTQGADGSYTALAVYKGTAVGRRETGYITTAVYRGEISMTVPGDVLYTVVYEGTPMIAAEPLAPVAPVGPVREGALSAAASLLFRNTSFA